MDFKKLLLKIKQKVLLTNYSKEQEAEFDISKNKIVCFLPNVSVFDNTIKAKIGEEKQKESYREFEIEV